MGNASQATILIVDDDHGLLRLIEKTLRRAGFSTATADSGADAFFWLDQKKADLMFLDLKLQDIDGHELISRLERTGRILPFVIITGQGDERVAVEMMKRGALDYVVKDAQFLEMIPAVAQRAYSQVERDRKLHEAQKALRETE